MMDLKTLETVNVWAKRLEEVDQLIESVNLGGLAIAFNGRYQPDQFVAKIKPAVLKELKDARAKYVAALIELGVQP